jgi:hypothetical protein
MAELELNVDSVAFGRIPNSVSKNILNRATKQFSVSEHGESRLTGQVDIPAARLYFDTAVADGLFDELIDRHLFQCLTRVPALGSRHFDKTGRQRG